MLTELSRKPSYLASSDLSVRLNAEVAVANEVDQLFAISGGVARFLQDSGVARSDIHVLPNGVDTKIFQPKEKDSQLERELGIRSQFVVGLVMNFDRTEYEGIETLLLAIAAQPQAEKLWRLLLVGDGGTKDQLIALANRLGVGQCVVSLPATTYESVPTLYGLIDVCVFPRRRELVTELVPPVKPLEAMASGIPVVVSDCSALLDLLREGAPVLPFPQGNFLALADILNDLRISTESRQQLGREGRDWVVRHRDWRRIAGTLRSALI